MKPSPLRRLLGGLVCLAWGLHAVCGHADTIAEDAFNYPPLGSAIDGETGGAGAPGWASAWAADATLTAGGGLTYAPYGLGLGYAVTLGDSSYVASFSRAIGNYNSNNVATSVLWMRMLYKPGAQVTGSAYTARPFELYTINFANILSLERTVGLVPEAGEDELAGIFSLNLLGATVASTNFDLAASSTSLLLFKLTVDQGTYQAEVTITNEDASTYLTNVTLGNKETLKMWVNPTASTEGGLGDPVAYATADVLQPDPFTGEANDSIAYFNSVGYGDTVDEIVFGTTLADALAPSTDPARLQPLIADDAFNYTPLGSSLDMGDGGSVGNNWLGPWSADVRAVAGPGLTYATYALGQGNGATLGDADNPGLISRELADYGAADVVWLRVLYSPGGQAALSPNTAVPFNLFSINAGNSLVLERTVSAGGGAGDEIYALSLLGSTNDTVYFDLTNATTYLLLCKLTVDQATDQNETLQMWINPTATSEAGLGTADVTLHADILGGGDDYLALFSALGYGDAIDELALGRTFAAATTPGTDPLTRLQAIWTGGSLVDAHWSTPENWLLNSPPAAGDHVLFPVGAARLANTNDLVTSVGLLTFGVGGYQIFGNPLTNNGGIANNILAGTTVWNTNLTLGAAQSFTTAQGGLLSLNGALANGGFLLTVDGEGDTQFNGVGGEVEITDVTVTGTGGLTKAGGGTLTLATATTYSGATTVDGGTLVVKGSTAAASAVTVAAGATLSGSNIVGGTVLLNGAIAPGVNVGSLATGAETWAAGASYDWQINQIAGTAGGTSGWDLLNITGGLAITATSNQPVTLNVSTLDPTTGASGQAGGTLVPTGTYAWKIAAVTTAITGFDLAKFNVVSTGFLNDTGAYGAFALETRTTAKELWLLYGQRPQITTDPVDLQVQCDGTPSFTVVAAGSGTLHYQWYFNTTQPVGTGTPVGTDAATWSTNSAVGNAGYYQCVVSSSYGSASSAEAQLQVVDSVAPVIGTLTAAQTQPYVGVVTVKDSVAPTLQGTVNFTVAASDACSGLVGAPVVTLTNGSTSETATYVSQSPAGVFNYTWTVGAATVLGTWTATVTAADTAGNVATLYPAFTLSVDTAQVSGQVELEGFVGTGTVPTHTRTVTFVATAGASVLKTWPLTLTNVSGAVFNYTLTQVPLTTTGISAKTDWNLRRKLAVTLVAGQGTANFTVANKLLGGDIDQTVPNFVTFADYLVLASYFGADVSTVPAAAQASISGVRFVNFVDYLVLSRNFGKIGDSQ